MMPIMDGIELIKSVRSLLGDRASVYIIAASADSSDTNRQACLDAGANVFVAKPIDSRTFGELIHQGLKGQDTTIAVQQKDFKPQINMSIIEDIADGDRELLFQITESIIIALTDDLTSFKQAILVKDYSSIVMRAHRMKGNLSQVGETVVIKLAEKIENFAKSQDIDSIQEVSNEFADSVIAVQKIVEAYLASN